MQFIPSTWRAYAGDADGNGTTDPLNINDAALGTAHYLCVAGGNLTTDAGQRQAVMAYNHSDAYVAQVLALAHAYAAGIPVADIPLIGNTNGPVPAVGPYGTPTAGAAPGPALAEASQAPPGPDAVMVSQPAASGDQRSSGGEQQTASTDGQQSTRDSGTPATVPSKSSPSPAAPQKQSRAAVPGTPSLPTPPSPPPLSTDLGGGFGLLPDGTRCPTVPVLGSTLLPCPTG